MIDEISHQIWLIRYLTINRFGNRSICSRIYRIKAGTDGEGRGQALQAHTAELLENADKTENYLFLTAENIAR